MRRAVVTGGSRGIGRAVACSLAADGCEVVAVGRDTEALAATARAGGERVSTAVCDVTDEAQVAELFDTAEPVDILVMGAGAAVSEPLGRTTLADWERIMTTNATSAFLCTRAVAEPMARRGWGRIVAVASVYSYQGDPYCAAYAASKHAVLGLVRVASRELAGSGVTVNAVCPDYVRTEMTERSVANIAERTGRTLAEAAEALLATRAIPRFIEPEEVAAAVDYLVSDAAALVTGEAILMDGGSTQR